MIHTLTTDCTLHIYFRDRRLLKMRANMQRKALILFCGIVACVSIAVLFWIIYR